MVFKINLTPSELALIIDALGRASNRLESMGRFYPRTGGPHERKAKAMRELRERLQLQPDPDEVTRVQMGQR